MSADDLPSSVDSGKGRWDLGWLIALVAVLAWTGGDCPVAAQTELSSATRSSGPAKPSADKTAGEGSRRPRLRFRRVMLPLSRRAEWNTILRQLAGRPLKYRPTSPEEFEQLVGALKVSELPSERLRKAEFYARLQQDSLQGTAQLEFIPPEERPALVPLGLAGWSLANPRWLPAQALQPPPQPASLGNEASVGPDRPSRKTSENAIPRSHQAQEPGDLAWLGVDADEQPVLLLDREAPLAFDWSWQGQQGPGGNLSFSLRLPSAPICRLVLDLPPGWMPACETAVVTTANQDELLSDDWPGLAKGWSRWLVEFGGRTHAELRLVPSRRQPGRQALVRETLSYTIDPSGAELTARLDLETLGGPLQEVVVHLDPGVTLLGAFEGMTPLSIAPVEPQELSPQPVKPSPGKSVPPPGDNASQPAIPEGQPAIPQSQPAIPEGQPAGSEGGPAIPEGQPAGSEGGPAIPEGQPPMPEQPGATETGRLVRVYLPRSTPPVRTIRLQAVLPVQVGTRWKLPSLRPIGLAWQQGSAMIRIVAPLVLQELEPRRQGGQVTCRQRESVQADDGGEAVALDYYTEFAEVNLRLGRRRAQFDVSGGVQLSWNLDQAKTRAMYRLSCRQGKIFQIQALVPGGWAIDSVQVVGLDGEPEWSVKATDVNRQQVSIELDQPLTPSRPVNLLIQGRGVLPQAGRIPLKQLSFAQFPAAASSQLQVNVQPTFPVQLRPNKAASPFLLAWDGLTKSQQARLGATPGLIQFQVPESLPLSKFQTVPSLLTRLIRPRLQVTTESTCVLLRSEDSQKTDPSETGRNRPAAGGPAAGGPAAGGPAEVAWQQRSAAGKGQAFETAVMQLQSARGAPLGQLIVGLPAEAQNVQWTAQTDGLKTPIQAQRSAELGATLRAEQPLTPSAVGTGTSLPGFEDDDPTISWWKIQLPKISTAEMSLQVQFQRDWGDEGCQFFPPIFPDALSQSGQLVVCTTADCPVLLEAQELGTRKLRQAKLGKRNLGAEGFQPTQAAGSQVLPVSWGSGGTLPANGRPVAVYDYDLSTEQPPRHPFVLIRPAGLGVAHQVFAWSVDLWSQYRRDGSGEHRASYRICHFQAAPLRLDLPKGAVWKAAWLDGEEIFLPDGGSIQLSPRPGVSESILTLDFDTPKLERPTWLGLVPARWSFQLSPPLPVSSWPVLRSRWRLGLPSGHRLAASEQLQTAWPRPQPTLTQRVFGLFGRGPGDQPADPLGWTSLPITHSSAYSINEPPPFKLEEVIAAARTMLKKLHSAQREQTDRSWSQYLVTLASDDPQIPLWLDLPGLTEIPLGPHDPVSRYFPSKNPSEEKPFHNNAGDLRLLDSGDDWGLLATPWGLVLTSQARAECAAASRVEADLPLWELSRAQAATRFRPAGHAPLGLIPLKAWPAIAKPEGNLQTGRVLSGPGSVPAFWSSQLVPNRYDVSLGPLWLNQAFSFSGQDNQSSSEERSRQLPAIVVVNEESWQGWAYAAFLLSLGFCLVCPKRWICWVVGLGFLGTALLLPDPAHLPASGAVLGTLVGLLWLGISSSRIARCNQQAPAEAKLSSPKGSPEGPATTATLLFLLLSCAPLGLGDSGDLLAWAQNGEDHAERESAGDEFYPVLIPTKSGGAIAPNEKYSVPLELYRELRAAVARRNGEPQGWLVSSAHYEGQVSWQAQQRRFVVSQLDVAYRLKVFSAGQEVFLPISPDDLAELPQMANLDGRLVTLNWDRQRPGVGFRVPAAGVWTLRLQLTPRLQPVDGLTLEASRPVGLRDQRAGSGEDPSSPRKDPGEVTTPSPEQTDRPALWLGMDLRVPAVLQSQLVLSLPRSWNSDPASLPRRIAVPSAVGSTSLEQNRLVVNLGATPRLSLRWFPGQQTQQPPAFTVHEYRWMRAAPGQVLAEIKLRCQVDRGWIRDLVVEVDPRYQLLRRWQATGLRSTQAEAVADGGVRYRLQFSRPASGTLELSTTLLLRDASGVGKLRLPPVEVSNAQVQGRWLAVSLDPALEFRGAEIPEIPLKTFQAAWGDQQLSGQPTRAFDLSRAEAENWSVAVRARQAAATAEGKMTVTLAGGSAAAEWDFTLHSQGPRTFQLRLLTEADFQCQRVEVISPSGRTEPTHWWQNEDGRVTIRFSESVSSRRIRLSGHWLLGPSNSLQIPVFQVEHATTQTTQLVLVRKSEVSVKILNVVGLRPLDPLRRVDLSPGPSSGPRNTLSDQDEGDSRWPEGSSQPDPHKLKRELGERQVAVFVSPSPESEQDQTDSQTPAERRWVEVAVGPNRPTIEGWSLTGVAEVAGKWQIQSVLAVTSVQGGTLDQLVVELPGEIAQAAAELPGSQDLGSQDLGSQELVLLAPPMDYVIRPPIAGSPARLVLLPQQPIAGPFQVRLTANWGSQDASGVVVRPPVWQEPCCFNHYLALPKISSAGPVHWRLPATQAADSDQREELQAIKGFWPGWRDVFGDWQDYSLIRISGRGAGAALDVQPSGSADPQIALAELSLLGRPPRGRFPLVAPDDQPHWVGLATFLVDAQGASVLHLHLPRTCQILAVHVDGAPPMIALESPSQAARNKAPSRQVRSGRPNPGGDALGIHLGDCSRPHLVEVLFVSQSESLPSASSNTWSPPRAELSVPWPEHIPISRMVICQHYLGAKNFSESSVRSAWLAAALQRSEAENLLLQRWAHPEDAVMAQGSCWGERWREHLNETHALLQTELAWGQVQPVGDPLALGQAQAEMATLESKMRAWLAWETLPLDRGQADTSSAAIGSLPRMTLSGHWFAVLHQAPATDTVGQIDPADGKLLLYQDPWWRSPWVSQAFWSTLVILGSAILLALAVAARWPPLAAIGRPALLVAGGLSWWLFLEPSLLGWAAVVGGLLLSVRPSWPRSRARTS